jgi:translation initiation factor IF-3
MPPGRCVNTKQEPKKDRMSLPNTPAAQQDARNREPRVNHRIRVPEVRLVGVEGEQLGIVPIEEAMRMAQDAGVDLVEVAAAARPPVCKLMDYGKFKYTQKKKAQEQKRTSTHVEVKEVKLRPKTDDHDYQTKLNQARRFLMEGDRVKLTVMFRGREIAYARAQNERLMEMANSLADIAAVDVLPKVEGRNMSMMLNPKRAGGTVAKPAEPVAPVAVPVAPSGPSVTTRGASTRGG